ncbi:MAG: DUF4118 domain-containing protein [Bilifractor sp.]
MRSKKMVNKEHVLVLVSTSPQNEIVIDAASRLAASCGADFSALFVKGTDFQKSGEAMQKNLDRNLAHAAQCGADVETIYGDNIAYQVSEYARMTGVTKIVIGRSPERFSIFRRGTIAQQILRNVHDIDVYVIPLTPVNSLSYRAWQFFRQDTRLNLRDILIETGLLVLATIIGMVFDFARFGDSNVIPLYLLAVLTISVLTSGPIYGISASLFSVFIFNYFFAEPRFSLWAYDSAYWITFLVMFISSILTSSMATRLKNYARNAAQNSYRMKLLFDINQLLQQASGFEAIAAVTANQLTKLLNVGVVVYLSDGKNLSEPRVYHPVGITMDDSWKREIDQEAASWAYLNRKQSGAGTSVFPSASLFYLSIRIRDHAYGVVGIDRRHTELDPFLLSLVLSIMSECALAMENEQNERDKEASVEAARNQKLRADLLRSLSHDLRTPLTSISGNASILLADSSIPEEEKKRIYSDIYDDSMWLIDVVQNLLAVTRLEGGKVTLNKNVELMDEVIREALKHIDKNSCDHTIETDFGDDILLARMDSRLIMQVVVNLVNNAIKYTQKGSHILIRAAKKENRIYVWVEDDGPGISPEAKPHIFEMFYSGAKKVADARRSLGLGLALCKSILIAHDGEIRAYDNTPKGTVFEFWIPSEEVEIHE